MPIERTRRACAVVAAALMAAPACAAAELQLAFAGLPAQTVYNARTDHCAPIDTPDIAPTAFRDADGAVVMFALHYVNRVLRGPTLGAVKIDCHVVLDSGLDGDPARYDDRRYMGSSWSSDGKRVTSIVHHEYHGEMHKTCAGTYMACWYNTLLSFSSRDGGRNFAMDRPAVVAAAPFTQDVGQGRHRGFFSPSNIVSDGRYKYFMASTTGWSGQPFGVCLFRSPDPHDSAAWRGFDGEDFTIRYGDPYAGQTGPGRACAIIEPFLFPVSTLVRHQASGAWLAVWMATKNTRQFPVDGFYYATSRNLKTWSQPALLRAGATIHNIPCDGGSLIAYPSLLDETARNRNFDDVGDAPWLYFTAAETRGCATGARVLMRERMKITAAQSGAGGAR